MKFSVATNLDTELIEKISSYPVYEVHGKLARDAIGGGRPSFFLKDVSKTRLEEEVAKAHAKGIEFNYLLNATCLGNKELTKKGMREINALLEYLTKIKVDTLTVTIPFLVSFIKENYSHFKIDVSTIASVNNMKRLEQWVALGANTITLDDTGANRNFRFLEEAAKIKEVSLKLMVNLACYPSCIHKFSHYTEYSHNSQSNNFFPVSHYVPSCKLQRVRDISTHLTGQWIRPEDIHHYEALGIEKFKIIHRHDSTDKILLALKAYAERSYDGNLMDIVKFSYQVSKKEDRTKVDAGKILKYLFKPTKVDLFKLYKISKLMNDDFDLYIDNKKLEGFIDFFKNNSCHELACSNCEHCRSYASKAISYHPQKREALIKRNEEMLEYFIKNDKLLFK